MKLQIEYIGNMWMFHNPLRYKEYGKLLFNKNKIKESRPKNYNLIKVDTLV